MFSRRALRGWRQMVVNQGWAAAATTAADRIGSKLRPAAAVNKAAASDEDWLVTAEHPFDRAYGVDTSGLIWGEDLASGSRNDAWNTAYYGIAPSVFHAVMARLPEEVRHGATFIDIGSGKGRAVMLAAQYPFAQIIGVEIAADLHRVATNNVAKYTESRRNRPPVKLLLQDAVTYSFPPGPLVVYLYHPFCRPVLERVLRNLGQSLAAEPRPAAVFYINLELREVLDRAPFLERIWGEAVAMDADDRLADRIGSSQEDCALYRTRLRTQSVTQGPHLAQPAS